MATRPHAAPPAPAIEHRILALRGHKVLLDADLARLYGVPTKRLNEQVRRNLERFPPDFMFQLTNQELAILRSQFATSSSGTRRLAWGGRRYAPYAFTEHGVLMAANVLNSARAIEVSVYVARVRSSARDPCRAQGLAAKLDELEKTTEALALKHDTLAANTRAQFKQVFEALRALMSPPEPKRRPIGFVTPEEKKRG